MIETYYEYLDGGVAWVSTTERKLIRKFYKLADKYPDKVFVLRRPEINDGMLYGKFPTAFLKLSPPKSLDWTPEQRQAQIDRMKRSDPQ